MMSRSKFHTCSLCKDPCVDFTGRCVGCNYFYCDRCINILDSWVFCIPCSLFKILIISMTKLKKRAVFSTTKLISYYALELFQENIFSDPLLTDLEFQRFTETVCHPVRRRALPEYVASVRQIFEASEMLLGIPPGTHTAKHEDLRQEYASEPFSNAHNISEKLHHRIFRGENCFASQIGNCGEINSMALMYLALTFLQHNLHGKIQILFVGSRKTSGEGDHVLLCVAGVTPGRPCVYKNETLQQIHAQHHPVFYIFDLWLEKIFTLSEFDVYLSDPKNCDGLYLIHGTTKLSSFKCALTLNGVDMEKLPPLISDNFKRYFGFM